MTRSHHLRAFQIALIWVSVFAGAALLWVIRDALLIAFGAILGALLLSILAARISRWSGLPRGPSLFLSTLLIVVVCSAVLWLFGSKVGGQLADVIQRADDAQQQLMHSFAGDERVAKIGEKIAVDATGSFGTALTYVASMAMNVLEASIVIVISAIYLAVDPELYRQGAIKLFPPRLHQWAKEAIKTLGTSLQRWLLGQLVLMLFLGLASFFAVWAVGLPSPLALGLITGISEIIPYLGPFIGAIPAVLIGLTLGVWPAFWTAAAYLGIHLIESYILAPLVQRYFVTIPPAIVLLGIMATSAIFGLIGLVFAAPLTVTIFIAVKLFYFRKTLKEPTCLPGEDEITPEFQ